MKNLYLFIFCCSSINLGAQISYENGYYITESGQRVECMIKNIDWKYNPTKFDYRLSDGSETKTQTIEHVKEFGIYDLSKYIKEKVNIDRSYDELRKLNTNRNPIFGEEILFLKVLVEGKANLYQYEEPNFRRYFYKSEDTNGIEQLVYKRYLTSKDNVAENHSYRHQLWNSLKCEKITFDEVQQVEHDPKDLSTLFLKYNNCHNAQKVNLTDNSNQDFFNLSIRPRLNINSLSITNNASIGLVEFDKKLNFGIGIEAEFILPFNKNKWAILIEPTYQTYTSEQTVDVNEISGGEVTLPVDYKSLEIPIGLRHYFYLNSDLKLFANGLWMFDISKDTTIPLIREDGTQYLEELVVNTNSNFAIGAGINYKEKFTVEARYQTSQEWLADYASWNSDFTTFSIIFGYTVF